MEFSFEYYSFLELLNQNTGVTYSVAFFGVLLLYIPVRMVINLRGLSPSGKTNILSLLLLGTIWFLGSITLAILSNSDPSGIKIFLVWMTIATVCSLFISVNGNRLFKIYTAWTPKNE